MPELSTRVDEKSKSQVKRITAQKNVCSMCGEDHAAVTKQRNSQRAVADEHQRLQSAVVEAAREWRITRFEQDASARMVAIKALHSAVDALIAFEAENGIGE